MTTGKKGATVDPLYQLFEHYLVTRSYDDTGAFTKQLAEQYLAYLDSTLAHVPFVARASLLEDLATEAHEMLVKKMYGCVRVTDYLNFGSVLKVGRNESTLDPVEFTGPITPQGDQNPSSDNK